MSEDPSRLLMLFVRHSERVDQVKEKTEYEKTLEFPLIDAPITEKGKLISEHAGRQARIFLDEY